MAADERAIRDVHSTWMDALNNGEVGRLLALMADDAVLFNPGQDPVRKDGFSANFAAAQESAWIQCRSDLEEIIVVGEVAYTRSRDALTVTMRAGGETAQLAGYRMTIYRKQPDGRWLLHRDAPSLSEVESP